MRVRQQNCINWRELFDGDPRPAKAAKYHQPLHKNRVDKQILAANLQQERRVSDESNAQLIGVNQHGRNTFSLNPLHRRGARQIC